MRKLVALGAFVLIGGCSSDGVCGSSGWGGGGSTATVTFTQCWDGQDREVSCVPLNGSLTASHCTCSVGGNTGASFDRTEPLVFPAPPTAADYAPINTGCGWALRPR